MTEREAETGIFTMLSLRGCALKFVMGEIPGAQ
jgi:hypothetical protein